MHVCEQGLIISLPRYTCRFRLEKFSRTKYALCAIACSFSSIAFNLEVLLLDLAVRVIMIS